MPKGLGVFETHITDDVGIAASLNGFMWVWYDPKEGDNIKSYTSNDVAAQPTTKTRVLFRGVFSFDKEKQEIIFVVNGEEYRLNCKTMTFDNKAMLNIAPKPTGGVNLRSDQADIQIHEDENGFKFPKYDPTMPMMPLQRLVPVILDLKFITVYDAALKLGLAIPEDDGTDKVYSPEKAREQEQVSAL